MSVTTNELAELNGAVDYDELAGVLLARAATAINENEELHAKVQRMEVEVAIIRNRMAKLSPETRKEIRGIRMRLAKIG